MTIDPYFRVKGSVSGKLDIASNTKLAASFLATSGTASADVRGEGFKGSTIRFEAEASQPSVQLAADLKSAAELNGNLKI